MYRFCRSPFTRCVSSRMYENKNVISPNFYSIAKIKHTNTPTCNTAKLKPTECRRFRMNVSAERTWWHFVPSSLVYGHYYRFFTTRTAFELFRRNVFIACTGCKHSMSEIIIAEREWERIILRKMMCWCSSQWWLRLACCDNDNTQHHFKHIQNAQMTTITHFYFW